MRPHLEFGPVCRLAAVAILMLVILGSGARGQDLDKGRQPAPAGAATGALPPPASPTLPPPSRIQITDVRLRRSAESAVRTAAARVAVPGCGALLFEFVDQQGVPLATRLDALQMSFQDYVHTVIFVDGRARRACDGPTAVTMPGSRVVYLCGALIREPHSETWVTIVHEVLHSLGLAEHPPTPAFISSRVRTLCQ